MSMPSTQRSRCWTQAREPAIHEPRERTRMASGPEHYWEAERLLRAAARGRDDQGLIDKTLAIRAAGVHATLALAAASALQAPAGEDGGMLLADAEQWERACSVSPPAEEDAA